MKTIDLQQLTNGPFASQQERLVSAILELVKPNFIFLLGASVCEKRMESIFSSPEPPTQYLEDCFLLIVIQDLDNKEAHDWQEKIEQHCQKIASTTTIVLQSSNFEEWLKAGHPFAVRVWKSALRIHNAGSTCWTFTIEAAAEPMEDINKRYAAGLNRAQEFLAGAELFRIRKQNSMAAFMLHQCLEQTLKTLLYIRIGLYTNTHNISRLLKYASFVSHRILNVFLQNTEEDKCLLNLLQKAYSDARYKDEYKMGMFEPMRLTEKVKSTHEILSETPKDL